MSEIVYHQQLGKRGAIGIGSGKRVVEPEEEGGVCWRLSVGDNLSKPAKRHMFKTLGDSEKDAWKAILAFRARGIQQPAVTRYPAGDKVNPGPTEWEERYG